MVSNPSGNASDISIYADRTMPMKKFFRIGTIGDDRELNILLPRRNEDE
jgi:hypothetical protein